MNVLPADAQDDSTFSVPLRIDYQHTDAGGIVFHANYLAFMEVARTEFLRAIGFDLAELAREQHVMFIVHRLAMTFLRPARLDDSLAATAEVERVGLARIVFRQRILREGSELVSGQTELAAVDPTSLRPVGLPASIKSALEAYAARAKERR